MPPLRPLPSQSLRPAWSASQLCRGPPAAGRPLPHSFRATEARSFATASDGANDANASARGDNGSSEGRRGEVSPADSNAGELKPPIRSLYFQRARGNNVAGKWDDPIPGTMVLGQDSQPGDRARAAAEKPGKHRKATSRSSGKKPRRRNAGDSDRLQRLLGSESSRRAVEQAKGIQTGVITKDTIMDDSTWQQLKQGLTEMAEEEVPPVVVRKVRRSQHRHEKIAEREMSRKDHESTSIGKNPPSALRQGHRKQLDPEPKPDPKTVRERLRDAIGNMQSSLSAQIEEDVAPGRYRQDVQHTTKSIQEQRLEELEELLAQASRRLRELQGYQLQDEKITRDNLSTSEVSHYAPPIRSKTSGYRETREEVTPVRGGAHATAGLDRRDHTDASLRSSDHPIRYLSKDPGRPLPHTTGQAIPPAMFGPRKNLARPDVVKEVSEQGNRTSLLDELFPGEAESGPRKSTQIRQQSSEERDKKANLGLVNEVFSENSNASQNGQQRWTAPLLEALFPELADNSQETQSKPREEREVPRLSLDLQAQTPEKRPNLVDRDQWINHQMQKDYQNEVVVVQLSGVSKNLSEEDIKRLVPTSSKYIEGWSDPDFIKVIPVRDEQTLERLDRYFILFRTVRAARNFQEHVKKLHTTVKSYAPSSLNSPLPPPPGFHDDSGRDINAAMQSYTIGPPSSNFIYCSIIPTPYPRPIRQLLTAGGYEPIISTSTAAASVTKVLLHFEGAQPSLADIRRTITRDGKDRWLPWKIVGGTNSADGVARLTTHLSRDEAVGNDIDALVVRKVPPRYVISFEDKAEAQRFVRRWNRTSFGWSVNDVYENGEGAPQARAEVLW